MKRFPVILMTVLLLSCSRTAQLSDLPIGVFDSGTGGLTVLERILTLDNFRNSDGEVGSDGVADFSSERFVYLADQANMPYGQYAGRGKTDYLRELVMGDAKFLLDKPVKIIVIACNTATAYGLEDVQTLLEQSGTGVKVIGVINAGVKATLECLRNETGEYAVGVLATPGTISSGAYERIIQKEAASRGISVTVVCQSGYGFAEGVDGENGYVCPAATTVRSEYMGPRFGNGDADIKRELLPVYNFEKDGILTDLNADGTLSELQLNTAANYARFNLVSLVEKHRQSGSRAPLKAIILGCTHYPFLLSTMQRTIAELRAYHAADGTYPYRDIIDENPVFIDPAINTADECYRILREDGNLAPNGSSHEVSAFISVPAPGLSPSCLNSDGSLSYDFKYGRQTGSKEVTTVVEPFSTSNISPENLTRLRTLVPESYSMIFERAATVAPLH